jgi:N-acetylglutamate synthase-like GNAT family acetyltransferase
MNIRRAKEEDFPQIIELIREFASLQKMTDKMIQEKKYFKCFIAINNDNE